MKKLNLTALTAAVLMGSSLLASSVAMALDTAPTTITAGSACVAYSSSSQSSLKPDWSTLRATSSTWVHCPGSGLGTGIADTKKVTFNLEIPVDALKDVYNCYVASQNATAGSATKKVIWKAGSTAGVDAAIVTIANATDFPANVTKSITSGCYLYTGQMLHSVGVE